MRTWVVPSFLLLAASGASTPSSPSLPASVELGAEMVKLGLPARAQGSRNTCSLFAVTALASFERARSAQGPAKQLSEEFLTWAANEATSLRGDQAMFYEAIHGLNKLGICAEERMPYLRQGGKGSRPSNEALAEAKDLSERWRVHWIKRWDVKTSLGDAQVQEIKQALANGHLVACGLRWPKSLHGSRILDVPPPEGVYDGHSIAFTGYRDDASQKGQGEFLFRNSAGARWGTNGDGAMSYAYARAYLNDAFWLELGPPRSELAAAQAEAEALMVVAHEKCETSSQDMKPWGAGMWSGGSQLLCKAEEGGFVEFDLNVPKGLRCRPRILATTGPDFGIIQATLDGQRVSSPMDLYSGRVSPAGALDLGPLPLAEGSHRLRVTSVGKSAGSGGYSFGLDVVEWIQVE